MPIDFLPGEMVVFDRETIVKNYLRDYKFRNPNADVSPNSLPYADAQTGADSQMVLMHDAVVAGQASDVRGMRGARLDAEGETLGRSRDPAKGGSGFVTVGASSGGTTIFEGDRITHDVTKLIYECSSTKLYVDLESVPVRGVDVGSDTNLDAGEAMTWSNPRPGCQEKATVAEQNDGSGLSGGHPEETDEEYAEALVALKANPPAAGNDAEVQKIVAAIGTVAVEQAFTVPAVKGPGTLAATFTVRQDDPTKSRIPNAAQLTEAQGQLDSALCGDDGPIVCEILADPVDVALQVTWMREAVGWVDTTPWPPLNADPVHASSAVAISASAFRVTTSTVTHAPQVGQTIGVYDTATGKFKRKRILTVSVVSANHTWDLTFDMTLQQSDAVYAPANGDWVSPWSDSLDSVAAAVLKHFAGFGPGEQLEVLPDPGRRQRRSPESPEHWPSVLTNRLAHDVQDDAAPVLDCDVVTPDPPRKTTAGLLGVRFYLMELDDLGVYPA